MEFILKFYMKKFFFAYSALAAVLLMLSPLFSSASTPLGISQGLPAYDGGYPMPKTCKSHYDPRAISGAYDKYQRENKPDCRIDSPFSTVPETDGKVARLAVLSVHPEGDIAGQTKVLEATTLDEHRQALSPTGVCNGQPTDCQPRVTGLQQFTVGAPVAVEAGKALTIEWSAMDSQRYEYFYHKNSFGIGYSKTGNATATYVDPDGISGSGPGFSPSGFYGSVTVVPPVGASKYTLTYGAGLASISIIINAQDLPVMSISASPTTVQNGGSTNLTWSAINVTSCTVSGPSFTTAHTLTGSNQSAGPLTNTNTIASSTYTYTLSCDTAGVGTVSQSVSVTVPPAALFISANPSSVQIGSVSRLTWNGTGYNSCTVSGPSFTTSKALTGSDVPTKPLINPNTTPMTNTYTIQCRVASATKTATTHVTVTPTLPPPPPVTPAVLPVINSFSASRVQRGSASSLMWNVSDLSASTTCAITPGSKIAGGTSPSWNGSGTTWQGSIKTVPLTAAATYTLSCSNNAGTVSSTATSNLIPAEKEI